MTPDWKTIKDTVSIPHSYNLDEKFGEHKVGIGFYRKELLIPEKFRDRNLFLRFEGVCLYANVYIDGILVGQSPGAYLPFELPLPKNITPGKRVELEIQVNNELHDRDIPDRMCNGWWIFGGLIREVYLVAKSHNRFDDICIRTFYKSDGNFDMTIGYRCVGTAPDSVQIIVRDSANAVIARKTDASRAIAGDVTVNVKKVKPWTPDNPCLYNVSLTPWYDRCQGGCRVILRGFAQLTVRGNKMFLNGKNIFIRGIGRHDVIDKSGPLLTRQERITDLADIKRLGCNSVRIAHFPQPREIYDICDSIGLIVMDEMPAWKTSNRFLGSDQGVKCGKGYVERLIKEHGNNTSVMIWSIGNEFSGESPGGAQYVEKIAEFIHAADPSRLVTFCIFDYQAGPALYKADFISINEYLGWYVGSVSWLRPMLEKIGSQYGKPVIVSEFGSIAQFGKHSENPVLSGSIRAVLSKDLSEEYQAAYIGAQIDTITVSRGCAGFYIWNYTDFMEHREPPRTKEMPPGLNAMGLVTLKREKKAAYDIVKEKMNTLSKKPVLK